MKISNKRRVMSVIGALIMIVSLLSGCGDSVAKEEKETITVYLWSTALYESYAPYIQEQLPDINIQFVVGNNDLDFYKYMDQYGKLPDIITCRRFSLHDAAGFKEQLMDLSMTEEAGAVYEAYLSNFTNTDGSINWLPLCAEVDGIVANKDLFEEYNIELPTDYDSFVAACDAFEAVGIRGFTADFAYDYTCMEVLQGWSIPEINSMEGRMWRSKYEDANDDTSGLDDVVWPGAFERMEKFIKDVKLRPEDVELNYDPVIKMFEEGQVAMIRAGGSNTVWFNEEGVNAQFLPYFGQNGEQWLLSYPAFQVALNADLEKAAERKEMALEVLSVMLSEEGQNVLAKGEDVITYNQNVNLELSPYLDNLKEYINQNHLYIRVASNDFFATSKDVVSKMLTGEYDAKQAYEEFDEQLKQTKENTDETILSIDSECSNIFHKKGGNEAYSIMANTARNMYESDVLIAPGYSFTGSVIKADYTEKMVGNMIMPNSLLAWNCDMTGEELVEYVRIYVEGIEGGFSPFNRGSLPVVSGISIKVTEDDGKYKLDKVLVDGKEIDKDASFKVTLLNNGGYMSPILEKNDKLIEAEENVKESWVAYIKNGGTIAEKENYITLK